MIGKVKEIKNYLEEWNKEFYDIIEDSPAVRGYYLNEINEKRRGLAGPGFAVKLFGDLFEKNVDEKGKFVESAIVFYVGVIDDFIDEECVDEKECIDVLNESGEYFISGLNKKYFDLNPIRNYIKNNLPEESFNNLISDLEELKVAAISEMTGKTYDDLKKSRIDIGSAYANQLITIINSFSDSALVNKEEEVIKNYCRGTTLIDSISDYYQDKFNKTESFVTLRVKNGESLRKVFFSELKHADKFISNARFYVPSKKEKQFNEIVNLAQLYFSTSFVKKVFKYGFK